MTSKSEIKKIKAYILERSKNMTKEQREHIEALSIKFKIEDGLIKNYSKLTSGQKRVLERMKAEEELVWSKGGGWWIGEDQTNGRLALALLRACVISQMSTNRDDYQIYNINETGRIALESGYLISLVK